jgi:hypothetical protein
MLDPQFRMKAADWEKETLIRSRVRISDVLDKIIEQEQKLRRGNQMNSAVLERWKEDILTLLDDTPGHPWFNYHNANIQRVLDDLFSTLKVPKAHPLVRSLHTPSICPHLAANPLSCS